MKDEVIEVNGDKLPPKRTFFQRITDRFKKKEDSKAKEDEETFKRIKSTLYTMDKMFDEMEEDHKKITKLYEETMRKEKPKKKERHLKLVK